jgi:hypothetical protein
MTMQRFAVQNGANVAQRLARQTVPTFGLYRGAQLGYQAGTPGHAIAALSVD